MTDQEREQVKKLLGECRIHIKDIQEISARRALTLKDTKKILVTMQMKIKSMDSRITELQKKFSTFACSMLAL